MSDTPLKWGILATGHIAEVFARGLSQTDSGRLYAIASRNSERAEKFAETFGAERFYGTYNALLEDPDVDAVYISTPHPAHAEWAIKAAEAKKHILCEKPMTLNQADAERVIEAARLNDVFLMEAFMYRCHPQTFRLLELIKAGTIGKVRAIRSCFSFHAPYNLEGRLLKKALGGGGILDVGCYPVSFSRLIAGAASGLDFAEPVELKGIGQIGTESGVDEWAAAVLKFENDIIAQVFCGIQLTTDTTATVYGTNGSIHIAEPWRATGRDPGSSKLIVRLDEQEPYEIDITADRSGYAIEADVVAEFIDQRQSPHMLWCDTLGNMKTLDWWRREIGLKYPGES